MEMKLLFSLLLVVAVTGTSRARSASAKRERAYQRFYQALAAMDEYDRQRLPTSGDDLQPLNVTVDFTLAAVTKLNKKEGYAELEGYLSTKFTHPRLRLRLAQDVETKFRVDPKFIWTPDIDLYNSGLWAGSTQACRSSTVGRQRWSQLQVTSASSTRSERAPAVTSWGSSRLGSRQLHVEIRILGSQRTGTLSPHKPVSQRHPLPLPGDQYVERHFRQRFAWVRNVRLLCRALPLGGIQLPDEEETPHLIDTLESHVHALGLLLLFCVLSQLARLEISRECTLL